MRRTAVTLAFLLAWTFAVPMGWAQKSDDAEHAELAKALRNAKISLQRGNCTVTATGNGHSTRSRKSWTARPTTDLPACIGSAARNICSTSRPWDGTASSR